MNVLVTGGTGFVGREVVAQLRAAGHSVRLLVRHPHSPRSRALATEAGVTVAEGDILEQASLPGAMAGCEAVVHLVGIISEAGRQTYARVHTEGTENVTRAARKAGVARFIHMSALGTRSGARSRYHQSKWAAEQIVRRSQVSWTIFRPSIIYGPGDGFVNLFARLSRFSPILPVMGTGQTRFQPVAVANVAACFVRALTEPRAVDQVFDLCGAETFSLVEIIDIIQKVTGRKRLKLRVPLGLAQCQAALLEILFPLLLRRAPPLNRDQLLMLQEDNTGDGQPARELFDLQPGAFEAGIAAYLKR